MADEYARIMVPLDGSPAAEQILPHVESLAERLGSTVILLYASAPLEEEAALTGEADAGVVVDPRALVDEEQGAASEYLEHVAGRMASKGLAVERVQQVGDAAAVIVEQAHRTGTDLVAMTTHGRGGLGRLIFGSLAESVLRDLPCPLLLVRVSGEGAS